MDISQSFNPSVNDSFQALIEKAEKLRTSFDWETALETYGLVLGGDAVPASARLQAHLGRAKIYKALGEFKQGLGELEKGSKFLDEVADPQLAIEYGIQKAFFYRQMGEPEKARVLLDTAIAQSQKEGFQELIIDAQIELANIDETNSPLNLVHDRMQGVISHAEQLGYKNGEAYARIYLGGMLALRMGQSEPAHEHFQKALIV